MEDKKTLNIKILFKKLIKSKKLYYKVLSIVLVLSALWIFMQPRYYKCSIQLAPESENEGAIGSIGSLASSLGFNLGGMNSSDAIYPSIYPDVVSSNDFIVSLFDVEVTTQDGELTTSYYKYLKEHTKSSIWMKPVIYLRRMIKKALPSNIRNNPNNVEGQTDPFWLTQDEYSVAGAIANNISCSVDEEYLIVTISVTDQDRLVCAAMADSVRVRLQNYITDYRTSKSRKDLEYFKKLTEEAKQQYDKACDEYSSYADSHLNPSLTKASTYLMKLENNMQQAYSTYNAFLVQQQTAEAKVQENTPAFTIIQGASVPIKPAGPKRMLFCFGMLILGFMGTSIYILRKDIF